MFEPIRTIKMLAADNGKRIKIPESMYESGRKSCLRIVINGENCFIKFGDETVKAENTDMILIQGITELLKLPVDATHISVISNFSTATQVHITFGYYHQ